MYLHEDKIVNNPEIIQYKSTNETPLHMHIFKPQLPKSSQSNPAIVFFSCGGWKQFDATKMYPQSEYLASRGIVCINAEVRVAKHGTSPAECVTDAKSAIRWARESAARYNIDPDRIGAGGGSAAGMVVGALGTIPGFDDNSDNLTISAIPNTLIMFNPVCNMVTLERRIALCGGIREATALSPVLQVKPDQPPALVMHPKDDKVVPVQQAIEFTKAMKDNGNRCDLVLWKKGGHGWYNYWDGANPWFFETLEKIDLFLNSLGWVDGESNLVDFTFTQIPNGLD